jgi:hypothetical protein
VTTMWTDDGTPGVATGSPGDRMQRIGRGVAVVLLVVGLSAAPAGAAGPDFTACADAGEAFGQCVAGIARDFRGSDDDADTSGTARGLVEGCAAFDGEQFGACVSEAARGQHERADPPGAAVSEAARSLVDGCRDLHGREFGECVRTGAHELGHGAGTKPDDDQDADDGKPSHEKKPKHTEGSEQAAEGDEAADGGKAPRAGKPAHAGKPSSSAGHGSGGRKP